MDISSSKLTYCFGILFFLYAAASLIWRFDYEAVYLLVKWFILIEAFVLGLYLWTLKQIFEGLALGITISSLLVLFGIRGGLFINPNTLSEIAALVLVGLCVYRSWCYIPGLLPSFIHGSRASFLSLVITFLIWFLAQYIDEHNSRST